MKKLLIAFVLILSVTLAACGNSDDKDTSNSENNDQDTTATEEQDNQDSVEKKEEKNADEDKAADKEDDSKADKEEDNSKSEKSDDKKSDDNSKEKSDLAQYDEYDVLNSKIKDIDSYPARVETDNPNTRVILFGEDNGQKDYKSIFVKRENRLKIIDLKKDNQIYNDIIK
ncbi:MAG TPA: hypothetical protein IAA78_08290 [Candidatus Avamphibacillus intestinigallinarum]|nr:hypothetical protein [Candidatus Avamphibacillus intestinigallinarum]